ncbi:MAG: histidine phosphatase family protein, partial [Actinobacteria bacterium]|nr:histidine phosphatase family protein [Actinomycetota bacterium]
MSSIDIYLCQHGRTPLNVAGRLRGHLDPELDLVGQAESRELAELLVKLG